MKSWIVIAALAASLTACSTDQSSGSLASNLGSTRTTSNQQMSSDSDAAVSQPATSDTDVETAMDADEDEMATNVASMPYDAMFLDMMIEHHEQGVEMSRQALSHAENSQVNEMAQQIMTDQKAEIDKMEEMREKHFADVEELSDEQLQLTEFTLDDDDENFDQRFLEAMIQHHQDAIAMAEDAEKRAQNAELKTMAREMRTKQQQEISEMRQLQETAAR